MKNDHHIFGFIGLTTSGKTTLAQHLVNSLGLVFIKAVTTRPKRADSFDEFEHVSVEIFENYIKDNKLVEYTNLPGHYYGKLKKDVTSALEKNHAVYSLTPDRVKELRKVYKNTKIILVEPEDPVFETIEKRLSARGHDRKEILRRLKIAEKELEIIKDIKEANLVDHVIKTVEKNHNHAFSKVEEAVKKYL